MPAPIGTIDFLGVAVADLSLDEVRQRILDRPAQAPLAYVVTPNAQHWLLLHRGHAGLRDAYAQAWLRVCDSRVLPGVAHRLFGLNLPCCPGSDLTAALFANGIQPDDSVAVIGGDEALAERLRHRFGLTRLALHAPPMGFIHDPAAVRACVDFLRNHPARFIFLAVGAPQSEMLAHRLHQEPGLTGTALSIGGSLLFITGLVPRAPRWMREHALEWLFRLARNPRGHARRVFIDSLPILGLALRQRLKPAPLRHRLPDATR